MNAYDFDGVVYLGDSSLDSWLYALKDDPRLALCLPGQAARMAVNIADRTRMKSGFFRFLRRVDNIEETLDGFWDTHMDRISPWYRGRRRADDIVISASPGFLVEPACRRLGIRHIIGTDMDMHSGIIKGRNCKGAEKPRRLLAETGIGRVDEFHSDSLSDAPMAAIAGRAFLVYRNGRISEWPWNQ